MADFYTNHGRPRNGHRFIALNSSAEDVVKTMPMEVVEIAPADYPVDVQKALALFE